MFLKRFFWLTIVVLSAIGQLAVGESNILVLVDNLVVRETHSKFLKSLTDRGHQLTIKTADDPTLQLVKYDQHLYDHLILFSPTVEEFGGSLSTSVITDYIDNGGNLLIAGGSEVGFAIRDLANECGLEFDKDGNQVIDHFNFDASLDDGTHTAVTAGNRHLIDAPKIAGNKQTLNPLLYRGTSLIVNKSNPLLFNVLTGSPTSYSYAPNKAIVEVSVVAFVFCVFSVLLTNFVSCQTDSELDWLKHRSYRRASGQEQRQSAVQRLVGVLQR